MYHQYDKAVQTVRDYLSEQDFSRTVCKDFRRATREFKVFILKINLEFAGRAAEVLTDCPRETLFR